MVVRLRTKYKRWRLDGHLNSSPHDGCWEEVGPGLHQLTIPGLLQPCLIFGESRIIAGAGTMAKLELALSPPTLLAESFTLLTLGTGIVACIRVSGAQKIVHLSLREMGC